MRVLVVDDSAFMRKIISEMIVAAPGLELAATACDGLDAVAKAREHRPDLVTLDIEMPGMDGLAALREIRGACADFPPAVLICSSLTAPGSRWALRGLREGASDFIAKGPIPGADAPGAFRRELIAKLSAIGEHRARLRSPASVQGREHPRTHPIELARVRAVVIGASTGGPRAVESILSVLPAELSFPILIAQHMPELFTRSFAGQLDQQCRPRVRLAEAGADLSTPGVYIAPGGGHLRPTRTGSGRVVARLLDTVPGAVCRPSVDLLYDSAASLLGPHLLAIQLSGMEEDGARGAASVRAGGGQVIAQSASSCVVYGMPRAVIDAGLADAVLSPPEIGVLLAQLCERFSGKVVCAVPGESAPQRSA